MNQARYAAKRAALLATASDVKNDEQSPSATLASIGDVAEIMQSKTKYSDFVVAGCNGGNPTLFLEDVIFAYVIVKDDHFAKVMKTENSDVRVGDFVYINEVRRLSEEGKTRYYPRVDRNFDLENRRAEILRILLESIAKEGGNDAVLRAFDEDQARREVEVFAEKIREDIKKGTLESDPMKLFDDRKARQFGFIIDGKPMVMRSGYISIGYRKHKREVYCLRLTDAPLGTSGAYPVEVYLHIGYIFSETPPSVEVAAFSAAIASLFGEDQLEEAKQLAENFIEIDEALAQPPATGNVAVDQVDDDAPGAAAEAANERAMRAAVHGPSPVAKVAPPDLVAHAAMVEGEAKTNGTAIIH